MNTSEQNTRIAQLEQALRHVNEIVQGTANSVELLVHVHALVADALRHPGEVPIYGRVLPWYVKADSEGTEVFRIKANAMAFRALVLREFPHLTYETSALVRQEGEMYWAVDYKVGSAEKN